MAVDVDVALLGRAPANRGSPPDGEVGCVGGHRHAIMGGGHCKTINRPAGGARKGLKKRGDEIANWIELWQRKGIFTMFGRGR